MRLDSLLAAARDHLGADAIVAEHGEPEEHRFANAKAAAKFPTELADICRFRFARDGEITAGWIMWNAHERDPQDRLIDYSVNLQPVIDRLAGADT